MTDSTITTPTVNIAVPAAVAPKHVSVWEEFLARLKEAAAFLEDGLSIAAADAPAAASVAETVEVATQGPAGVAEAAATAEAVTGLEALNGMVHSATSGQLVANTKGLIQSVETVVAASKPVAVADATATVTASNPLPSVTKQ